MRKEKVVPGLYNFPEKEETPESLASRLIAPLEEQMEGPVPGKDYMTNPLRLARQMHLEASQAKPCTY